jgi:glycosyltransferase involved in cell wall biosynthesis
LSVLFLHTAPFPKIPGTDAIYNEVELLRAHFGGTVESLFPLAQPNSLIPRPLYGWHKWRKLKLIEKRVRLIHVFSPGLYYYPFLSIFQKPVLFTVTAAIGANDFNSRRISKNIRQILVTNVRDQETLQKQSFEDVKVVEPGLDLHQFNSAGHLPVGDTFHLLMASAPWEISQFDTKGVDILLEAVSTMPNVELTLLWRGSFKAELEKKIKERKLKHRVRIINELANVPLILEQVHATILLAKSADLVKAYPHSLLESLAMGRPVLLSDTIAMADYVDQNGCGVIVSDLNSSSLQIAILKLAKDYDSFSKRSKLLDVQRDFSPDKMIDSIQQIYQGLI